MFQYALGRNLSKRHASALVLDCSWYQNEIRPTQPRPLALRDFLVQADFRSGSEFRHHWIRPTFLGRIWWRFEQSLLPPHRRRFVAQRPTECLRSRRMFDSRILKVKPGTYLSGWWISPQYFAGIEETLRGDFVLRSPLSTRAASALAQIHSCNSVAVHVRRGDYINHPEIGILDANYYSRAIGHIRSHVSQPKFFLFSDDVGMACQMLRRILPEFETMELEPDASPALDLTVMAACKHFITANSTFSWWGAWLNDDPNKEITVPKVWFGPKLSNDTKDLIPSDWNVI